MKLSTFLTLDTTSAIATGAAVWVSIDPAQGARGLLHRAIAQALTDARAGDDLTIFQDRRADLDRKAEPFAGRPQVGHIANAVVAEGEILAAPQLA